MTHLYTAVSVSQLALAGQQRAAVYAAALQSTSVQMALGANGRVIQVITFDTMATGVDTTTTELVVLIEDGLPIDPPPPDVRT